MHIGPLARTVADAALMTSVMAGPHDGDPLTLPDDGVDYMRAAESMRRDFRVAYSPNLGDFPSIRVSPTSLDRRPRRCRATVLTSTR